MLLLKAIRKKTIIGKYKKLVIYHRVHVLEIEIHKKSGPRYNRNIYKYSVDELVIVTTKDAIKNFGIMKHPQMHISIRDDQYRQNCNCYFHLDHESMTAHNLSTLTNTYPTVEMTKKLIKK